MTSKKKMEKKKQLYFGMRRRRRWLFVRGRVLRLPTIAVSRKILRLDNIRTNVVGGGGDGNMVTRMLCISIITIRVGGGGTCEDDDGDIHYTRSHTHTPGRSASHWLRGLDGGGIPSRIVTRRVTHTTVFMYIRKGRSL